MTETVKTGGAPRWLRSVGAVVAGLVVVIVLSSAADAVLHATGVFPPVTVRMEDPMLFLVAVAYRGLFTVLGGWVTAKLAPVAPMKHVIALALIGLALGVVGVVAELSMDLGPLWYALAVAITGPLCTLLGGWLYIRKR